MVSGNVGGGAQDEVILDFGASGIWIWKNNSFWVKLHSASPQTMVSGNIDGN